ncbi:MAG: helix-hairpin-helix domain-containing protein [Longimonas sp.]|uniref:helix-hairpin-helix domain-containing protein n=1 Tax=Longimonas sp. TaxID=2039626 RepID=UPI003976C504
MHGIGEKTAQTLLREFGSLKQVKQADTEALAEVVGPAKAQKVAEFYREAASEA